VSIYDLEVPLLDQHGATTSLDVFRGHPTIVVMFYASCRAACPRTIDDLLAIEAALPEPRRQDLRILMVSFDPDRDSPSALGDLATRRELDPERWRLAAAREPHSRQLAAVLGVKYRVLDDGEFFHSSVFMLVDATGRPTARIEGLGRSAEPILSQLR